MYMYMNTHCSRLSVLVKYHKLYAVNMAAICDLIRRIKDQVAIIDTNPPMAHEYWVCCNRPVAMSYILLWPSYT